MNALQVPNYNQRARRGLVSALRWAADRVRPQVTVPVDPVVTVVSALAVEPVVDVVVEPEAEPVVVPSPGVDMQAEAIRDGVVEAMRTIFDPEIPVDIYELGLIYSVDVRPDRSVGVRMTLTSPNCPAAQSLPAEVELKAAAVDGVDRADVEVVFEPAWTPDLMSDAAKLELNIG